MKSYRSSTLIYPKGKGHWLYANWFECFCTNKLRVSTDF